MKPVVIIVAAFALGLGAAVMLGIPSNALSEAPGAPSRSAEAHRLVEGGAMLLDVRTPEEFSAGHLPQAVNIPVDDLLGRAGELGDHARPIVVYCRSGHRSAQAARILGGAGFLKIHDLGPMSAW